MKDLQERYLAVLLGAEFLENLATAAQSLQKTVPAALDFIAGKPLDAVFG